jgi:hypothetical protein
VVTGKPAGDAGRTGDVSETGTARLTANAPYRHEIGLVLANDVSPVWSANNSRRYRRRVQCLQTRADSGMMSTCCSWREHVVGIISDILRLVVLFLRSSNAIRAENLVLRKQLGWNIERGIKPRRVDHATRVSLALFSRLFDWRDAVVNVRPSTIVRWHRLGWRIFWRLRCRPGRPPIPPELVGVIRRMAAENPLWGEERIANELLVKLGIPSAEHAAVTANRTD